MTCPLPALRHSRLKLCWVCLTAILLGAAGAIAQNTPAAAFNPQLLKAGNVSSIIQEPDGKLIIGGGFTTVNGLPALNVARLNLDGSLDQTWTPAITGGVTSLVIIGNYLYVGGAFQSANGATHQNLLRISLSGNGTPDPSWNVNTGGGSGEGTVYALATDGTNLYFGGDFDYVTASNGFYSNPYQAAKISPASSAALDTTWNANFPYLSPSGYGGVRSMVVSGDELYIGGHFTSPQEAIVKVTQSTGALDPDWNAGAFVSPVAGQNCCVNGIALDGTGGVYAVGNFATVAGASRLAAVKLSGSAGAVDPVWNPNLGTGAVGGNDAASAVAVAGGDVYLLGYFQSIAGQPLRYTARVDMITGIVDPAWAPQQDQPGGSGVFYIEGSTIYLGGLFNTVGGEASLGIAELDPHVGTLVPQFTTQVEDAGVVYAMAYEPDGKLVIGGDFYYAGGLRRPDLARLDTDGTLDATWAASADSIVQAITISGTSIYVGGQFHTLCGLSRNFIGRLTTTGGAADPNWNPGADNEIQALAIDGANVYAAGNFQNIGGAAHAGLAKLDAGNSGAADPAWSNDLGGSGVGQSLAVGGGELYVGGNYSSIGGIGLNSLARIDTATGTVDTSWTPNLNEIVMALVLSGTDLYASGSTVYFGGPGFVEKVSTTGNGGTPEWVTNVLVTLAPPYVTSISLGTDGLYIGGSFDTVQSSSATLPETDLAKLDPDTGTPDPAWQKPASLATASGDYHSVVLSVLAQNDNLLAGGVFTSLSGEARNGLGWLPTLGAPVITQDPVSGLITLAPGPGDSLATSYYNISAINGGTLALGDGTPVTAGSFITVAQGAAGLTFTATSGAPSITAESALDESGNGTGTPQATLMVGQPTPVIQFAATSGSADQGEYLALTVTKSGTAAATVQYATEPGSAAAFDPSTGKGDFIALNGVLNFGPGAQTATITVPLLEDASANGDLVFQVALSAPTGAQLGTNATETVTIINNNAFGPPGSDPVITLPGTPTPAATGSITMDIDPAGVGLWRPQGDFEWHAGGTIVAGLPPGNYPVEFMPEEGYTTPNTIIEPVPSGIQVTDTAQYVQTGSISTGSLTVDIQPGVIASSIDPSTRGQWRIPGQTVWQNSGDVITGLDAGAYTIEFTPVAGYATPSDIVINVAAGQTNAVTALYLIAQPAPGTPVAPVGFATATGTTPYLFTGELETDIGYATGTVVTTHAVLTVAHAIFNDDTLSYVTQMNWFFQRQHGVYDPPPQIAQGSFVFDGYASQRATDIGSGVALPDVSTPASQNLDVAVLYFLQPPGRGGSGGFLESDSTPNSWLGSNQLKMLAGYPVEGIPLAERGQLFATPALTATFTNLYNEVYATNDLAGFPGVSGGPVYVQDASGDYFPAAVYLGGTQQSLVRAIDDQVVSLINRAETAGNGGGNNVGGGVTGGGPSNPDLPSEQPLGAIAVASDANVGGWRVTGETNFHPMNAPPVPGYYPGTYEIQFQAVPYFAAPAARPAAVQSGQTAVLTANYVAQVPPSITSTNAAQGVRGQPFSYSIVGTYAPTSYAVVGALPGGLTLDSAHGVISGLPAASGSFSLELSASNAAGSGTGPLTLLIAPVLVNQAAPTVANGQPLDYTIVTSDAVTSFAAMNLPSGLSLNGADGEITGAPATSGSYSVPISITNAGGTSNAYLSLLVAPSINGVNTLRGTDSLNFTTFQISNDPNTTYQATGLPPGLSLDAQTGQIGGTPSKSGTYNVTLSVTGAGGTTTEQVTIIIDTLLTVNVSGPGTVDEVLAGGGLSGVVGTTTRQSAEPITLEALPGAGDFFAGWTGGLTPAAATFSFNMIDGLSMTAHFASFASARGSYNGLAVAQTGTTAGPALVGVALDSAGGFSGHIRLGAASYPFHGAFGNEGSFNVNVSRGARLSSLPLAMNLKAGGIIGNLTLDGTDMVLALGQTTADGHAKKSAQAGYYTVAFPHPADASLPQGDGFGSITVGATGLLRFAGTLGDGTPVSQSVYVSDGGGWPLFAAPYAAGGTISGALSFTGAGQGATVGGTAAWFKTGLSTHKGAYPAGFSAGVNAVGAAFATKLPIAYTSGTATIGAGGITAPGPYSLRITASGHVTSTPAGLSLSLSPATGNFSGTFRPVGAARSSSFHGVLFQNTGQGYGEFTGSALLGGGTSTGFVELKAQ